jgi:glycosyltransferase involved in cell wall biosynthesis
MAATKVLHISTWRTACGIATYCENFVKSLDAIGIQNEVYAIQPSEWVDWLPIDIERWRQSVLEAAKGCNLVHIQHEHGLFGYALGQSFACKRFGALVSGLTEMGIPFVTTFHTDVVTHKKQGLRAALASIRKRRMWSKHVFKYFGPGEKRGKAIVHSMRTRRSFIKYGFPADALTVISHPCLNPRTPKYDSRAAKVALGFPEEARVATIFGFVSSYKGHDLAIDAVATLPENFHLAIVGGTHPESKDTFMSSLLDAIPEALKARVRITGWVDQDTAELYFSATDICVAPYRGNTELSGSGAITWPLSSGKPVIASKIDAFQDINRKANCMFMFTPDCVSELAWAIRKVDSDEALRSRLVENAATFCNENSWSASVGRLLAIYKQQGVHVAGDQYPALAKYAA